MTPSIPMRPPRVPTACGSAVAPTTDGRDLARVRTEIFAAGDFFFRKFRFGIGRNSRAIPTGAHRRRSHEVLGTCWGRGGAARR